MKTDEDEEDGVEDEDAVRNRVDHALPRRREILIADELLRLSRMSGFSHQICQHHVQKRRDWGVRGNRLTVIERGIMT